MGDISIANLVSLVGYRHWDVVLNPDVLDSQQPREESDGHSGHTNRSHFGYARPVSLGATSVLCDNGIAQPATLLSSEFSTTQPMISISAFIDAA